MAIKTFELSGLLCKKLSTAIYKFHYENLRVIGLIFVALIIMFGFMIMPMRVNAGSFVFQDKVIAVMKGQIFMVPITIDPSNEKNYTARLALSFSPDILEVISFMFDPNWLALSQSGYNIIDNENGEFIKTAGYPAGFFSSTSFGVITFRAKQAGETIIAVGPRSFILNARNKSTLESMIQARVIVVEDVIPEVLDKTPLPDLPLEEENIFDISLLPQIQTTGAGLVSKVAPGEFLPISVKLINFGGKKKIDVTITYEITDFSGKAIYSAEETVAVETTATFVKTIQIPFETTPGRYIAKSSIVYQDQIVPATTEFPFTVERKILSLFQSDFFLYGGITFLVSIFMLILGRALIKRRRATRFTPFDYSNIPHDERIFYEILSDTIMEMRGRVGDGALKIAANIDGLKIDIETGRVLALTEQPSKIIATLVSEYEKLLGKKVSFSFRREKTDSSQSTSSGWVV